HHAHILVVPCRPVSSVAFKDANLIVQGAKPIGVLLGRSVIDRPELAYPQRNVMLLRKLRALGIEEEALLFCQVPHLGTACRAGRIGSRILAGAEARYRVVMRAVGEVIVEGLLKTG